jgi:hypothetical protein
MEIVRAKKSNWTVRMPESISPLDPSCKCPSEMVFNAEFAEKVTQS